MCILWLYYYIGMQHTHTSLLWGFSVNQADRQLLDEREGAREGGRGCGACSHNSRRVKAWWVWLNTRRVCARYSSTGGWIWIPAARRLPSLAKAAGEKAERGWPTCRRRSTLSIPKRGYKDCKGKTMYAVMEPIQPALSELWGDKVDRVMDACEPGRESINENLQQHGFGSLQAAGVFPQ